MEAKASDNNEKELVCNYNLSKRYPAAFEQFKNKMHTIIHEIHVHIAKASASSPQSAVKNEDFLLQFISKHYDIDIRKCQQN